MASDVLQDIYEQALNNYDVDEDEVVIVEESGPKSPREEVHEEILYESFDRRPTAQEGIPASSE